MSDAPTNVAPMPKRAHHGALSKVTSLQDAFSHPDFVARIKQATPKHLSPDRMLAVFVQSVQKTPDLAKCSLMSLLGAFLSVATVGLEPNTALQHAHLIPFNKRVKQGNEWVNGPMQVQVIFGYQGLLELAYRSGLLRSVHSDVAWSTDEFDFWYGSGGKLRHKPLGGTHGEGEMPEWAYMHANMKNEGESFEVMPMSDVLAIRDASQGYKAALSAKGYAKPGQKLPASFTEAPWVKHFVPMARKTAFRAGSKWLPKSIELAAALALDELQDRKTANFSGVIEGSSEVLTGLDPLPDDALDQIEGGLGGTFTGYGQQAQGEPATAGKGGQVAAAQQQAQAATGAATGAAPAATAARGAPGFAHYLVDAEGEVAGDLVRDAGSWAEGFAAMVAQATDKAVLVENNADAIAAARTVPAAAALLTGLDDGLDGGPGPAADALDLAIPMKMGAKGPDLAGWVKLALLAVPALDGPGLLAWEAANEPTYQPFPASKKLEVLKALSERATALGVAMPDRSAPKPAPAAVKPKTAQGSLMDAQVQNTATDLDKWQAEATSQLSGLITEASTLALAGRVRVQMDALKLRDLVAWQRLDGLFEAHLQSLRAAGAKRPGDGPLVQDGDPGPSAD